MAPLAAFAQSERGHFLAAVSKHFGVDPAQGFTDDVIAYNFRVALLMAETEPEEKDPGFLDPDFWRGDGA